MGIEKSKAQGESIVYERAMEFRTRGPKSVDAVILRVAAGVMLAIYSLSHPRSYAHLRWEFDKRTVSLYGERK